MRHDIGGINPQPLDAFREVGFEQGAIVAADVQDQVAGFEPDDLFGHVRDAGEMVPHGLVDAGAIPIGGVKHAGRHGMAHLHQTAGILVERRVAAHEIQRDAALHRRRAVGFGKSAADELVAERNHGCQGAAAAKAAGLAGDKNW